MAEIVNLRQVRKRKARAGQAAIAATNRALHGRTAAERERDRLETDRARRMLDGARLPDGPGRSGVGGLDRVSAGPQSAHRQHGHDRHGAGRRAKRADGEE